MSQNYWDYEHQGTLIRLRTPQADIARSVIVMLHGWTGDEKSMWVFESMLPKNAILITIRGLYPTAFGGYGWSKRNDTRWLRVADLLPTISLIQDFLTSKPWNNQVSNTNIIEMGVVDKVDLVGFSQGAALAFSFALIHPQYVSKIAGLSGFLPDDFNEYVTSDTLENIEIFLAHGTLDNLVPVGKARFAAEQLEHSGARVSYCEDDVGHKLSATCFNSLKTFFSQER